MQVPFVDLKMQYQMLKAELDEAVFNILTEGTFIMGEPVTAFEEQVSRYLGTKALGCASGSDALLLALMASDIQPGDEVITTPFTFFATAGAIARLGAKPVFVDIDPQTFNLDPVQTERAITEKTKAIIPVHIFGQVADMDMVTALAKKYALKIIEDACQAIGAEYKGKKAGTLGDYGCFSFFPTKNLGGAGDGGLLSCTSVEGYDRVKYLRVHGAKVKYFHDTVGINSRLDSLQAAILGVKLKYLDDWNAKRQAIADLYTQALSSYLTTPYVSSETKHVFHQYVVLADNRDEFMNYLNERGIATGVYYPLPLHLQKCFTHLGYSEGDLPVSESVSKKILSLPVYPEMTDEQVNYVISTISGFFA